MSNDVNSKLLLEIDDHVSQMERLLHCAEDSLELLASITPGSGIDICNYIPGYAYCVNVALERSLEHLEELTQLIPKCRTETE